MPAAVEGVICEATLHLTILLTILRPEVSKPETLNPNPQSLARSLN